MTILKGLDDRQVGHSCAQFSAGAPFPFSEHLGVSWSHEVSHQPLPAGQPHQSSAGLHHRRVGVGEAPGFGPQGAGVVGFEAWSPEALPA